MGILTDTLLKALDASPELEWELPDAYGAKLWAAQEASVAKGAGHRYIRRTGTPGHYRYTYHAAHGGGVDHERHLVQGSKLRTEGGHYEITHADGDNLRIRHDETGETKAMTRKELAAHLREHHKAALDAHAKNKALPYSVRRLAPGSDARKKAEAEHAKGQADERARWKAEDDARSVAADTERQRVDTEGAVGSVLLGIGGNQGRYGAAYAKWLADGKPAGGEPFRNDLDPGEVASIEKLVTAMRQAKTGREVRAVAREHAASQKRPEPKPAAAEKPGIYRTETGYRAVHATATKKTPEAEKPKADTTEKPGIYRTKDGGYRVVPAATRKGTGLFATILKGTTTPTQRCEAAARICDAAAKLCDKAGDKACADACRKCAACCRACAACCKSGDGAMCAKCCADCVAACKACVTCCKSATPECKDACARCCTACADCCEACAACCEGENAKKCKACAAQCRDCADACGGTAKGGRTATLLKGTNPDTPKLTPAEASAVMLSRIDSRLRWMCQPGKDVAYPGAPTPATCTCATCCNGACKGACGCGCCCDTDAEIADRLTDELVGELSYSPQAIAGVRAIGGIEKLRGVVLGRIPAMRKKLEGEGKRRPGLLSSMLQSARVA